MWDPVNINCTWHWIERRSWKKEEKKNIHIYHRQNRSASCHRYVDRRGSGGAETTGKPMKTVISTAFQLQQKKKEKTPNIYRFIFPHFLFFKPIKSRPSACDCPPPIPPRHPPVSVDQEEGDGRGTSAWFQQGHSCSLRSEVYIQRPEERRDGGGVG